MEFKDIEPYFKAILKELHSHQQLYMYASEKEIINAYNKVRKGKK